jgi:hypothetical protein
MRSNGVLVKASEPAGGGVPVGVGVGVGVITPLPETVIWKV